MSLSHTPGWIARAQHEREIPHSEASALLGALRRLAEHNELPQAGTSDPPGPALSLAEAYRICFAITRKHSRSFYLSTQLLPREKRSAIRALYAFCRTSDDIVDQPGQNTTEALAAWVAMVHAPEAPRDNAVLLAWNDTVQRYAVPHTLPDELLAGIAMDLAVIRYPTFDHLWLYCYRVASVVGLISMHIIGYGEDASRYAIKLGVALQLTKLAIAAAAAIYRGILGKISANGYDVFQRRAYVPLAQKLLILWRVRRRLYEREQVSP